MSSIEQRNLTIYHSNHLDILKDLLIHLMQSAPLNDPFTTEQIVIQSQGMEQWLKQEIAKKLAITANIAFPYPSSFIWRQYSCLLASIPSSNPLTREKMRWKIMRLLPAELGKPEFASLKYYLQGDNNSIKRFQLAEKIADIYDQYLVFRPQWILDWEQGMDQAASSQPWQPILWRKLISSMTHHCHRASVFNQFEGLLSHNDRNGEMDKCIDVSLLPERIFIFGMSAIPPQYLRALELLSQYTPVHLFFHNPSSQYWIDLVDKKIQAKHTLASITRQRISRDQYGAFVVTGENQPLIEDNSNNTLLASMGQLGQDFYKQLLSLQVREIEAFASHDNTVNSRDPETRENLSCGTLLAQIQEDILLLREPSADKLLLPETDRVVPSLSFQSCHSPVREIEILHDQLLHRFSMCKELTPKDIVVMIPAIDDYSSYIQAVFERFDKNDKRYIPFSISDRSIIRENPVFSSFLQLLRLPQSRCTANELFSILEVPAVLKKFQLSVQDLKTIRPWIKETGIRWGLDKKDSELFDLPQLDSNHWTFGLQRMFAGYAMSEDAGVFQGKDREIMPYDGVEGNNAELLGKLAFYIETITQFRHALKTGRSITQWHHLLKNLIDSFYYEDQDSSNTLAIMIQSLADLEEEILESQSDSEPSASDIEPSASHIEPSEQPSASGNELALNSSPLDNIEQALMVKLVESILQQQTSKQKFLSGKVNFCSLMPMRAIPFKVVCLLGMNDGVFPSNRVQQSFDLLTSSYMTGDRSHRDDERYMFLEAILSARQQLYISYVGHSINDNSEKIPSVLVAELQEYCEQRFKLPEDSSTFRSAQSILTCLLTEHPLQPFSQAYYHSVQQASPARLFSYVNEWLPSNESQLATHKQRLSSGTSSTGILDTLSRAVPQTMQQQESVERITLEQLSRFYANPCQYYLHQTQHVYFTDDDQELEESEAFQLDGLQYYQLKMDLLHWHRKFPQDITFSQFRHRELNRGHLGYHLTAENYINRGIDEVTNLVSRTARFKHEQPEAEQTLLGINVLLPSGIHLQAQAMPVYPTGIIECRPAKSSAKNKLQLWLRHLLLCAYHRQEHKHLTTIGVNNDMTLIFTAVAQSQAIEYLQSLVDIFLTGLTQPAAFFPETSFSFIHKGRAEAMKKFNGTYRTHGEINNAHIQRCYCSFDTIPLQQLDTIARMVFEPMVNYLTEMKDE